MESSLNLSSLSMLKRTSTQAHTRQVRSPRPGYSHSHPDLAPTLHQWARRRLMDSQATFRIADAARPHPNAMDIAMHTKPRSTSTLSLSLSPTPTPTPSSAISSASALAQGPMLGDSTHWKNILASTQLLPKPTKSSRQQLLVVRDVVKFVLEVACVHLKSYGMPKHNVRQVIIATYTYEENPIDRGTCDRCGVTRRTDIVATSSRIDNQISIINPIQQICAQIQLGIIGID